MGGLFSAPALPKMGGGKKGRKASGKGRKASGKGRKASGKGAKPKKGKPARRGRKSRSGEDSEEYGEAYEDYEEAGADYEDYEDYEDFTEERVMSYGEEYAPPGTLMSEKFVPGTYMTSSYINLTPADFPTSGQSASVTKTGKPTKPPTAGKSKYANESSPPGINLSDAMPLSPMVERTVTDSFPMNFSVVLLTILFIVFVMMRK